jgi:hypothetical protein
MVVPDPPAHLIGDATYDFDHLDERLRPCGVNLASA